jgi:hypothetical protein
MIGDAYAECEALSKREWTAATKAFNSPKLLAAA